LGNFKQLVQFWATSKSFIHIWIKYTCLNIEIWKQLETFGQIPTASINFG